VAIYFATFVSVVSAVDYFLGFWKQIDGAAKGRRQAAVVTRKGGRSVTPVD
jgi:CDP-diacylglycerol--glycerol-3-phosphate 3-phosphatidyltransferase